MAENIRTTPLRLRPSEHRALLFIGDLIMSVVSVFAALYTWREYNTTVEYSSLIAQGIPPARAELIVQNQVNIEVPLWFYLLAVLWMILLVELYEPHVAGSGRKTSRGIAFAAFVGLLAYSLVFLLRQNSDLPSVGVGAFLFFASLLTLGWRMFFIRIYMRTGLYYNYLQPRLAQCPDGLLGGDGRVFFANSGAEANEGAIKLARRLGQTHGGPARHEIVAAYGSFHGRTLASLAATGQPQKHEAFQPLPPGFRHVPFGDFEEIAGALDERVCAVLVEAVQGEGGVQPAPDGYLEGLRSVVEETNAGDV